jgi:primosomal protein N' (replication factor Y) (superfamily II helicase)
MNVIFIITCVFNPDGKRANTLKILKIALPVPLRKSFDYAAPLELDVQTLVPGQRVRVPFQKRQLIGLYLGVQEHTRIDPKKLKAIDEVLDQTPILPPEIMKLCLWAADYYHYPIGEVLQAALPGLLRKGKPLPVLSPLKASATVSPALTLNAEQQHIVEVVSAALLTFGVFTIDGVTGSGKTEVYLQIIQQVIQQEKQVLVLVPEINLTPQTVARFQQRFSVPIVALHSGLTEKSRLQAWAAARTGAAQIIIGTRSSVFTPLANMGLIIVDEEHDPSFKQHETFRYNARDLAIWRARDANIPIILGSATPSLETLHRSWQGHYHYCHLSERAGGACMPDFHVVDVRRKQLEAGLSPEFLREITSHLQAGNQVMLFLNRRGFSPVLMCHACGWVATCHHCDARMTYHLRPPRLHCHHCEAQLVVTKQCPSCGEKDLQAVGLGTERLEEVLQQHFPDVPMMRMDRDTTRKRGRAEELLSGAESGAYRILVGTQMLAKGHHFPDVTFVGIVDSDSGLFSSDFRASERLGQLILQVAGRAGRADKPGSVWLQTHQPEHPLIQLLTQDNYQQFAKILLAERESALLPPYAALALFHAEAHRLSVVEEFLAQVKTIALNLKGEVTVRGPISALMSRRAGRYRMQLLFQAEQKKHLQAFLRVLLAQVESLSTKLRIHWALDVDPLEVL